MVSDLIGPHGFVVFRGYGVISDQEFHDFIECFGLPNFLIPDRSLTRLDAFARHAYLPRMKRRLRSSTFCITRWHKRLSSPVSCFFCEQAPTEGGATPIGRSDLALVALESARPDT